MSKAKVAVLVSGGGTNLQALIDYQKKYDASFEIKLVISNKSDAYAIERAKKNNIKAEIISKKDLGINQKEFEQKIIDKLEENNVDIIVLAGFMCILSENFTSKYPKRILNIHPSLIPEFCGKGFYGLKVHEEVLKAGVKVTGATVHYVNEIPDGGEIITQKKVEVKEGDTPEILQKRVMEEAEWIILPESLNKISCEIIKIKEEGQKSMNIYETKTIKERIENNSYVGRGIIIGKSENNKNAVIAYFIMGRSENSRNRVFVEKENEVIIYPFDETKVKDPSLIIYSPIRVLENETIVTNGDQTDTIYDFIKNGKTFEEALETREFEPDAPNYTPRISGIVKVDEKFTYKMSILKSADEKGTECNRYTYSYNSLPGIGHFIHTYICDGNPIPTFVGEPERVQIPNDIDEFTNDIWNNLNLQNKISLYVRYIDLETGKIENRLINKNK